MLLLLEDTPGTRLLALLLPLLLLSLLLLASSVGTASRSASVLYLLQMAPFGHGVHTYGSSHHLIFLHCFGCEEGESKAYNATGKTSVMIKHVKTGTHII